MALRPSPKVTKAGTTSVATALHGSASASVSKLPFTTRLSDDRPIMARVTSTR